MVMLHRHASDTWEGDISKFVKFLGQDRNLRFRRSSRFYDVYPCFHLQSILKDPRSDTGTTNLSKPAEVHVCAIFYSVATFAFRARERALSSSRSCYKPRR